MKAIRIDKHGGPEVVQVDEIEVPKPGPGEVLVQVKASAMNHMDLWVRKGMPGVKIPLPIILGCDGAGVVEEAGPGVTNHQKGAEVVLYPSISCAKCEACLSGNDHYCRSYQIYGEHRDGTQTEYMVVPEINLLPKPKNLSFEEAGSVSLAFMTAWQMLVDRARVQIGEDVLVLAAASGVGSAAVQIAKLHRCRVIATVGSDEKADHARDLGADEVINHSTHDIADEVRKLTNKRGVDVIFEHVGQATWEKSLKSLAFRGRIVTCGATTGYDVKIDLRHLFIKQQEILGSTMGRKASLFKILRLFEQGKLRPVVDEIISFADILSAHKKLERRSQFGKIVLIP